jgi:CxxC-x17-CxxC domain-containing protein
MSMDRDLVCRSCGTSFAFTSGEQAFYLRMGFNNVPSRCPECRAADSQDRAVTNSSQVDTGLESPNLELFASRCSQCGAETQVSALVALGDEPVYCSNCLAASQAGGSAEAGGWRDNW